MGAVRVLLDAGAKVEHMPDGQILNGRFRFPIFGAFIKQVKSPSST